MYFHKSDSLDTLSTTLSSQSSSSIQTVQKSNNSSEFEKYVNHTHDSSNPGLYLLSQFSSRRKSDHSQAKIMVITNCATNDELIKFIRTENLRNHVTNNNSTEKLGTHKKNKIPQTLNYHLEKYEFNRTETVKPLNSTSHERLFKQASVRVVSSDHLHLYLAEMRELCAKINTCPVTLCKISSATSSRLVLQQMSPMPASSRRFNKHAFIDRTEKNTLFKRIAPTYFVE